MDGIMAPIMYLAFVTNHYLVVFEVEEINGTFEPRTVVVLVKLDVYVLVFNNGNLVPERRINWMVVDA